VAKNLHLGLQGGGTFNIFYDHDGAQYYDQGEYNGTNVFGSSYKHGSLYAGPVLALGQGGAVLVNPYLSIPFYFNDQNTVRADLPGTARIVGTQSPVIAGVSMTWRPKITDAFRLRVTGSTDPHFVLKTQSNSSETTPETIGDSKLNDIYRDPNSLIARLGVDFVWINRAAPQPIPVPQPEVIPELVVAPSLVVPESKPVIIPPLAVVPPPVEVPPLVIVTETQIKITEQIMFETNKAVIDESSYPLLDAIVQAVRENPDIALIRIEGHTSTTGSNLLNWKLSSARAQAVQQALTTRLGTTESARFYAVGYGEEELEVPTADNVEEPANRRVEFAIMLKKTAPGDVLVIANDDEGKARYYQTDLIPPTGAPPSTVILERKIIADRKSALERK
ncbi:MAG TPA: OmpA family protein, partial [bacterium]|nr:OmpA family protein [bacterium]